MPFLLFSLVSWENQTVSPLLIIALLCRWIISQSAISLLLFHKFFLPPAVSPLGLPDLTREICVLSLFCRAPSSASAKTATPGFFVRNMTPATTDLVATTAPALTSGRGVKDATSRAPVNQVCVVNLFSFQSVRYCCLEADACARDFYSLSCFVFIHFFHQSWLCKVKKRLCFGLKLTALTLLCVAYHTISVFMPYRVVLLSVLFLR